MWPFRRGPARPAEPAKPAEPARPAKRRISDTAIARVVERRPGGFMLTPLSETPRVERPFEPAKPLTQGAPEMAFDSGVEDVFAQLNSATYNFGEGIGFMGYGYLAELAQRPEYRRGCEVLAREMTRRWIKLTYNGEEDDVEPEAEGDEEDATPGEADKDAEQPEPEAQKSDVDPEQGDPPGIGHNKPPRPARRVKPSDEKLKRIEAELKRLKVREAFRRVAELDGVFGRGHIYLDTGDTEKPEELRTPLTVSKVKIGRRKKLKRLVVVEPTWTYPQNYDSRDPLKPEFFEPQNWLVMQKSVHASRLLTFVGREVPDMLKPAYSFGGLSLIQMAKPYVDNWLRTRQSVSDILHAFTVWVVKTDLNDILNGSDDGDQVVRRAELFNRVRDNRGLMMVDKESEDFANVSAPLAGLDHLQAQAQEQMASVFAIPLVVLLGITPSGLNASSDGEIRVFYDFIHAFQEHLFGHALHVILKIVQLSLFGEIDEDIGFEFLPLWQPTETDQATIRKTNADIDKAYIDGGVLDPSEVREKIANDKDSPYQNIDPDAVPEPPQPAGGDPFGADPDDESGGDDDPDDGFPPSSGGGERAPVVPKAGGNPKPPERRPAGGDPKPPRAQDAAFREQDHPRGQPGNAGQFGPGGGKSKTEAPKPKSKEKKAA
jgi:phage-related protein (TIGR01555 family)